MIKKFIIFKGAFKKKDTTPKNRYNHYKRERYARRCILARSLPRDILLGHNSDDLLTTIPQAYTNITIHHSLQSNVDHVLIHQLNVLPTTLHGPKFTITPKPHPSLESTHKFPTPLPHELQTQFLHISFRRYWTSRHMSLKTRRFNT